MGNLALVLTATFSAVHGGMTASGTNSIGDMIRRPSNSVDVKFITSCAHLSVSGMVRQALINST